jgi:hypothetical protein
MAGGDTSSDWDRTARSRAANPPLGGGLSSSRGGAVPPMRQAGTPYTKGARREAGSSFAELTTLRVVIEGDDL